ncbi:EamA family transporter [Pseudomonas moraviensis]|uniref:DMT family transporter n=1 Tax=Pseudomonas TaxID=286 RepID=UPI00135E8735|nr:MULTISPECIES: EamA family transporter [Pseudomonas]MXI49871.1 EamA family transporter [Pseudomonas moraviensis]WLG64178.1 EamA family transporter [Pseudomonas sp. FP1762]
MNIFTESRANIKVESFRFPSSYMWLSIMVLLWGASWPVTKNALLHTSPLWLASIRFSSAGLCLFCYLAVRGQLKLPVAKDLPIIASVGLLQMMAFTGLVMVAMVHIDASRAVLLAYTTPLWCAVAAFVIFREAPSKAQVVALIIGLVGVGVVCSPFELDWASKGTVVGAIFLLLAGISWAFVILHVKKHNWVSSPVALAPWQMLHAAIPLSLAAYVMEDSPTQIPLNAERLGEIFFIGPAATSVCFVISAEYGRRISAFGMSNFTMGVPLIGILFSYSCLDAPVSSVFLLGFFSSCLRSSCPP